MPGYLLLETAQLRHEDLMREAEAVRRVLRSGKLSKTSPLLRALVVFLISIL